MKKALFLSIFFIPLVTLATNGGEIVNSTVPPVASIGVGNGNTPENIGPLHGSIYHGEIPVFVTVVDTDLDNYHFRVIKDGGVDGYTCEGEGALFAPENQGYASTTLSKTACGFVFNQSVYVAPSGFTNSLIATLNTADLIAHSGEGDYWFILGALDTAGNRTQSNYLNDARVKITATSTPVVVETSTSTPVTPTPAVSDGGGNGGGNSGGGSGGNGPIVGTYGVINTGNVGGSNSGSNSGSNGGNNSNNSSNSGVNSVTQDSFFKAIVSDSGFLLPSGESNSNIETDNDLSISIENSTSTDNTAAAFLSRFNLNWLWLLLLIVILGGGYYFLQKK